MENEKTQNQRGMVQKSSDGRNTLWDFIRGMAMLSVLLHHSGAPVGVFVLAFHMPFFFLLSGYIEFARGKEQKFGDFLKNRFMRLLVPYFLFEILNLLLWQVQMVLAGDWQSIAEALKSILYVVNTDGYVGLYGRLWFWPCLFVSEILFFFVKKYLSGNKLTMLAAAAFFLGLSWITARKLYFRLPFTMDTALFATVFLILGYVMGEKIHNLLTTKLFIRDLTILVCGFGLLYAMIKTGTAECLMFVNWYGNYLTTLTAILSGCAAFLVLSKWCYLLTDKIGILRKLVLWYGRNSLLTFPIHLTIKIYFMRISWYFCIWQILFPTMLLFNIPIVNLITRYFPFMMGRKSAKTGNTRKA